MVEVEKLLQLLNLEQCHLDLVLASQHTFGLAAEAVGPLIRHRHHLEAVVGALEKEGYRVSIQGVQQD